MRIMLLPVASLDDAASSRREGVVEDALPSALALGQVCGDGGYWHRRLPVMDAMDATAVAADSPSSLSGTYFLFVPGAHPVLLDTGQADTSHFIMSKR